MSVADRISRLEAKLAKLTRPKLVIRRSIWAKCEGVRPDGNPCAAIVSLGNGQCRWCGAPIPPDPRDQAPNTQEPVTAAPAAPTAHVASSAEAMTRRCRACDAVVPPDARFCPFDGVRLVQS